MHVLGIDIGGSGIKGAPVDVSTGELLTDRFRIDTPSSAKPEPVAMCVKEIAEKFNWRGPIGVGFPAALQDGVALTASNIHKNWVGTDVAGLFKEATHCPVKVINDADAAGVAEMAFGAGKDHHGVVLVVTVGTGLGTSIFTNRTMLPNTELGHIEINGKEAETWASDAVRKDDDLSWKKWGKRLDEYLTTLEQLLWPDLIIIGGGVSKKFHKYSKYLSQECEVVPAELKNEAGIIGAAAVYSDKLSF